MRIRPIKIVAEIQSISPIGAACIFAAAWIASLLGLAAVLIVAALLAGLYLARLPSSAAVVGSTISTDIQAAPVQSVPVAQLMPSSPIADAMANGLQIRKIEFATASNGRAKKQTVSP